MQREIELRAIYSRSMRIGYADPPYPGHAEKYRDQPTYGGEVDHVALIAALVSDYDGWALSTSSSALRQLLPLCPEGARVCAWHKPNPVPHATRGLHKSWEPVIVMPARHLAPGLPDALRALPARLGGSTLIGRKPTRFCAWLFQALGALPGDSFADLYPGSGIVGRAWTAYASRQYSSDASRAALSDACEAPSLPAPDDVSPAAVHDASSDVVSDVSARALDDTSSPGLADASPLERLDTSEEYSGDASAAGGQGDARGDHHRG